MTRHRPIAVSLILAALLFACTACITSTTDNDAVTPSSVTEITFKMDGVFSGWTAGFADYPAGQEAFFELSEFFTDLPAPLPATTAFRVSGNNHSDDLFMFVKNKIAGVLRPNTRYQLRFALTFATNVPSGCVGVGGAPGEGVTIKAGATATEPLAVDDGSGFVVMNIDKGNQATSGSDAIAVGDFANSQPCASGSTDYELKTVTSGTTPFTVFTDADGAFWLLFGTDSGFEGTTTIYFVSGKVTATPI